jgi:hypothetical protein
MGRISTKSTIHGSWKDNLLFLEMSPALPPFLQIDKKIKPWSLLLGVKNKRILNSKAKFYSTEVAVTLTPMAGQIHGAYGLSPEYLVW